MQNGHRENRKIRSVVPKKNEKAGNMGRTAQNSKVQNEKGA